MIEPNSTSAIGRLHWVMGKYNNKALAGVPSTVIRPSRRECADGGQRVVISGTALAFTEHSLGGFAQLKYGLDRS